MKNEIAIATVYGGFTFAKLIRWDNNYKVKIKDENYLKSKSVTGIIEISKDRVAVFVH